MLLLRMILHPSSLASLLYTHITHTYAILFKDLTYHHEFLMKEQKMELKLLRCVLSPMPEIAREINSVIWKHRVVAEVEENPMTTEHLMNCVKMPDLQTHPVRQEVQSKAIVLMTVLIIPVNVFANITNFVTEPMNKVPELPATANIRNVVIYVRHINIPLFHRDM